MKSSKYLLTVLILSFLTSDVIAADADLTLRLEDFSPRILAPGEVPQSYAFSVRNAGPGSLGSASFGVIHPDPAILRWTLSLNGTFGDQDDISLGKTTLELRVAANGSTIQIVEPSIRIPNGPTGRFHLFARVEHDPSTGLTDPNLANNVAELDTLIEITDVPTEAVLTVDGIDDFAVASGVIHLIDAAPRTFTFEAWVLPEKAGTIVEAGPFRADIVHLPNAGLPNGGVGLGFTLFHESGLAVTRSDFTGPNFIKLNAWNHVAVMFDEASKAMTASINGQTRPLANFTGARFRISPVGITLGRDYNGSNSFRGSLDEIALSSSVRYRNDFIPWRRYDVWGDQTIEAVWHFDFPGANTIPNSGAFRPPQRFPLLLSNGASIAVTHPLRLFRTRVADRSFSASFPGEFGSRYVIQFKNDLRSPWQILQSFTASSGVITFTDNAPASARFYRVEKAD